MTNEGGNSSRRQQLAGALPVTLLLLQFIIGPWARTENIPAGATPRQNATGLEVVPQTAWTGDLDGMLQRRYIRALVAYSKTQYYVVNGAQRGSAYEFLSAFESELNHDHPYAQKNLRLHVVFIPVPRDQMLSRLARGLGDLAVGALTVTPGREASVDFSDPLGTGVEEIVVIGPQSSPLNSVEDLAGKEVFVRRSSSYWEHLQALNTLLVGKHRPAIVLRAAPEDLEDEDILEMLNSGLIQYTVTDDYLPRLWGAILPHLRAQPNAVINDSGAIAWAVRRGCPQLMSAVNQFMRRHRSGTVFGNTVIQKYAVSTRMLHEATSPMQVQRFERTADLFRKYSTQFDVDYLLMMAQGFQESGLDQDAKSKVGAVGVMQIMPTTGKEMKVGNIHEIDANVHAGVKYIRFMVDRYFADQPMTATNRLLFAFAAYNAGPGRIHSLRVEAAKRGLDPNVWFSNVEVIAAQRIGMETPTYVANIYKYYIAYQLLVERQRERNETRRTVQPGSPLR